MGCNHPRSGIKQLCLYKKVNICKIFPPALVTLFFANDQNYSLSKYDYSSFLCGLQTANLSWQTRVGKLQKVGKLVPSTRQTRVKSQHTVICKMADLVQWHSRRTVKKRKNREETKQRRNRNIRTKPNFFCLFLEPL